MPGPGREEGLPLSSWVPGGGQGSTSQLCQWEGAQGHEGQGSAHLLTHLTWPEYIKNSQQGAHRGDYWILFQ